MKTLNIEVHAATGGDDAKLFAMDLLNAYSKFAVKNNWKVQHVNHETISISGKGIDVLYNEAGSHRVQRIPPTEKRGRVHTSTVTVAVIDPSVQASNIWYKREPSDYKIEWYSGTGKGGQNRNKVQCCCRLTHIPSGITKTAQTRSRENSYQAAKTELDAVLDAHATNEVQGVQNNVRQSMMGSGQRADKRRTYRFQDDSVVDHITGKKTKASKLMKGGFDLLWK